jgi:2-desacetyl-2-hydroxyethyl bacteriochlorophyllide A dehydrogenase
MSHSSPEVPPRHARALWFTGKQRAELLDEEVGPPGDGYVLVRAIASLVSTGTEMAVYRGQTVPTASLGLETCKGSFAFPLKYAYQTVGEVLETGPNTRLAPGQVVFARHPHQDLFAIRDDDDLITAVPAGLDPERASFANLLAVALNANLDVPIRHGDCVVVFGQGAVGSLTGQLARRTAGRLVVVDPVPERRAEALAWGADMAVHPEEADEAVREASGGRGADVSIEASGSPSAMQAALRTTGLEGTVTVISYYGTKQLPLYFSPEFHSRRQRIVSSQVGRVASSLQARWSVARRSEVVFDLLRSDWLVTNVSERLPFERAPEAYQILDTDPARALSVVLTY